MKQVQPNFNVSKYVDVISSNIVFGVVMSFKYAFLKTMKPLFFCASFMFLAASDVFASNHIYTAFFSNKALSGYDPVAYFKENKPVKGDKRFTYKYKGAQWFFSSQENLDLFKNDEDQYAPQYGGYCAWAVGENKAFAAGNPKQWSIIDDKLYLNYNREIQDKWLLDTKGFIEQGDKNWPEMIDD